MLENIEIFFKLLKEDKAVADELKDAQNNYPGSWEIREPFVKETLLAVADRHGLPFSLDELRKYETRVKLASVKSADGDSVPEETVFYLIDQGWENDPDIFKQE